MGLFRPSFLSASLALAWVALALIALSRPALAQAVNSCEGGVGGAQPLRREQLPLPGQGYECRVTVYHSEDLRHSIAEKVIRVKSTETENGLRNLGDLVIESERGRRRTRVFLKGIVRGWPGEEEATFVLVRSRERGEKKIEAETIGRTSMVTGTDKSTSWIDQYKVDVSCRVLGLPEVAGDGRGGHPIGDEPLPPPSPAPSPVPGDGRGGHGTEEHV